METKPEVSELEAQQHIQQLNTITSDIDHVPSHGDYKVGLDAVKEVCICLRIAVWFAR